MEEGRGKMTKTLTKFSLLLATVCALFGGTAYADWNQDFYLQIVNTDTGSGAVINVSGGALSGNFQLDNGLTAGAFYIVYTEEDAGGTPAQSTMAMLVNLSAAAAAHIQITIKDSGYDFPNAGSVPVVGFSGTLTNYDDSFTIGGNASLTGTNNTATFQTWINTADSAPAFSPADTGGNVVNGVAAVNVPAGTDCTLAPTNCAALSGSTFGEGSFSDYGKTAVSLVDASNNPLNPNGYALVSQATINFENAGTSQFALVTNVSTDPTGSTFTGTAVPEPTSLFLLGSGLVGLGVVRRKQNRTV